ncbi:ABC transporter permease subunit [Natribaculum luteum]|uniref:ABC transporter permease subunit n=1 Tax=Natribaculum luteum TaxID=1586232 RepID=A0ABD5NYM0_9EURY|nr:ABC transporter permease subunit [Natribaculum luteum]
MSSLSLDSVRAIAKKDFQDAARSKVLWLLTLLFVAFLGGMAFLFVWLDDLFARQPAAQQGAEIAAIDLIFFLQTPVALLIPLIGLLVGYKALAGEVDSGSAKILFSLPHSRLDAIVGKFIGRTLVLWTSFFAGLLVAVVVVVALYDEFNIGHILVFTLLSLLFGAVYVGLGVAISALTKSTTKAAAAVVGVFFFFSFVFDRFRDVVYYLLEGQVIPAFGTRPPNWYLFYPRLSPGGSYGAALAGLLPEVNPLQNLFPQGEIPFYFSKWVAVVILILWIVVPLGLSYLRFEQLDL